MIPNLLLCNITLQQHDSQPATYTISLYYNMIPNLLPVQYTLRQHDSQPVQYTLRQHDSQPAPIQYH